MTMKDNGLCKLIEECGELVQIAAKKQACMDSDEHWDKAGSLKARLEAEIADVHAAADFVSETFGLDAVCMTQRYLFKLNTFRQWHAQLNDAPKGDA